MSFELSLAKQKIKECTSRFHGWYRSVMGQAIHARST